MNSALEFHDSKVGSVQVVGASLRIVFSTAYIHRSSGSPGVDSGDGFIEPIEMSFGGASFVGDMSQCVGALWDGSLSVSGKKLGLVPVPFNCSAPVLAELNFSSGALLTVKASSVSVTSLGDAVFVEHFRA
jgi:hypothetical protein